MKRMRLTVYKLWIPQWSPALQKRVMAPLWVKLPHEVIARLFERSPSDFDLSRIPRDDYVTETYAGHALVKQYGIGTVLPLGFYSDKVKLGQSDNFVRGNIGVTFRRRRTTCVVIKGSRLCRCGCNNMCTLDAIYTAMHASINMAQESRYMTCRLDGGDWVKGEDELRKTLASSVYPCRGALTEYRADLPERCQRAGLKNQGGYLGCFDCTCKSTEAHTRYHEARLHHCPWPVRTHESYLVELWQQLVKVSILDKPAHDELLDLLGWTQKYPWGRSVHKKKANRFNLQKGDRIIIGGDLLTNPHDLDGMEPPYTVF